MGLPLQFLVNVVKTEYKRLQAAGG